MQAESRGEVSHFDTAALAVVQSRCEDRRVHEVLLLVPHHADEFDGEVAEVVLATNFTNEGEATAHYISETLKARGLSVTRLARGVPVGGELEYVDAGTIARAMLDRRAT